MINQNIYNVDYTRFVQQLLPIVMRTPKLLDYITALVAPIVSLYNQFYVFKNKAIYKTEHNASVTLLQKMLNDGYDAVERRIFINNAEITATQHYYDEGQGDPLIFYDEGKGDPQWFFNLEVFNVYQSDFTVFLPEAIRPANSANEGRLLTRIKADLDYYKIYGTKYTIVWYS